MTRIETLQIILNAQDEVTVAGSEITRHAFLRVGNYQQSITLSLGIEHISQVQQLLDLLWAMKDEQQAEAIALQQVTAAGEVAPLVAAADAA